MVLLGVGQPGNDAKGLMLPVTLFPTTSPWVLWDGRPHSHAVLVLPLVALVLVMSHHGIPVLVVDPLREPVLVLALVRETREQELADRVKSLQRLRTHEAAHNFH